MSNDTNAPRRGPWPRWSRFLITLVVVAGVGSLIWSQLPGGAYPTDMSRIGQGRPTLVLAHDANYAGGMAVMELMNAIRNDYAERVDFLVAHLGMPDGAAFASRHSARDGTVLLFDADGARVGTLHQPPSVGELRQALDTAFGL